MADIPASTFLNFFIYLFIPFTLAFLLKKKRISPLIGYMLGGVIMSNFLGNFLSQTMINSFAYFGIILLLFTVGLETQFDKIANLKKFIVLGGLLQVGISIAAITVLSIFFGFTIIQAFLIGIALSSSSTTLVAKIIQDRGEESSFLGEIAIGILMFQDLAFIPFMIIFTSLTAKISSFFEVGSKILIDVIVSFVILWLVYYLGKKIIPFVFNRIARVSRELLNLFIIIFIFFIAYVSTLFHVPILVSIFIAGILIAQTLEHYHIFSQIRPLRDILAIIFFIFIGTTINLGLIGPFIAQIIWFTFLVVAVKAIIILVIGISFRFNSRLSTFLSLYLFQIDEDAFILMSLAYANKLFGEKQYLFIITSVLLSLVISPLFINNKEFIYDSIRNFLKRWFPFIDQFIKYRVDFDQSPIDALNIKDHVIICGYGRVGAYIGRALMLANIPFIAIDYNFHMVELAKKEGISIIYGDPTDPAILDYAEIENAVTLILAVPDRFSQEAIVLNAKKMNKDMIIISRVHRKADHQRMRDLGAHVVIQPEFEASLSIIKKIFLLKRVPKEEIVRKLQYFKLEQGGL